MKTVADVETKVYCLRIIGINETIRIAFYPMWLRMVGHWYFSEQGMTISDFDYSLTFTPPIVELKGSFGDHGVTVEKLLRGDFRNAKAYLFATSWINPIEDEEPIGMFIMDQPEISGNTFTIELRHIIDALNLTPEYVYIETCQNTFCDKTPEGVQVRGSNCGLDGSGYFVSGTIESFSGITYYDGTRTEAVDWFKRGYIRFNTIVSGEYVWSKWYEVISYIGDGFTLFETPLYNESQLGVGTEYQARVGCDKTLAACRDKFNNVVNATSGGFFGFPNIPNSQQAGKIGGRG